MSHVPGRTLYVVPFAVGRQPAPAAPEVPPGTVRVRRGCPHCGVGRIVVLVRFSEHETTVKHEGPYLCAGAARALARGGREALVDLLGGEEVVEKVGLVAGILGR